MLGSGLKGHISDNIQGILLGAYQGIMNIRVFQSIRRRADGCACIAEDLCYVFPLQALNQSLCTSRHDSLPFYLFSKQL